MAEAAEKDTEKTAPDGEDAGTEKKPARKGKREYAHFGSVRILKQSEPNGDYTPEGEYYVDGNGVAEEIAWAINKNLDILVIGDTGTGKTSIIRWMAEQVQQAYRRFPCDEATDTTSLIGKTLVDDQGTYFQKGIVYDAMEQGHWLVLDEFNAAHPDVRLRLNPVFNVDEGCLPVPENEGEVLYRHSDFRLFATANPYSYAGVKEMNQAIMSRFDIVIQMDYLGPEDEQALLQSEITIRDDRAEKMVKATNDVRKARKDGRIRFPMSYREIKNWAAAASRFKVGRAADLCVINKCDEMDQDGVREILKTHFTAAEWG